MGTCKECKWWREPSNKMGQCIKTMPDYSSKGVGYWTDRGHWETDIYTGPDFGCIHFDKKENE